MLLKICKFLNLIHINILINKFLILNPTFEIKVEINFLKINRKLDKDID